MLSLANTTIPNKIAKLIIIRTIRMEYNNVGVRLNDNHELDKEVPNINTKTNKVIGMKKVSEVFQTEVYLQGTDIERFESITKFE